MPLNPDRGWIVTTTVRSQLMLEAISAMVGIREWPEKQAKIHLRQQGPNPWRFCLFASDTGAVIPEVARREVDIASINPAFPLTMALRGTGPFNEPVPLRMITVIPSPDRYVFAVLNSTGLTSLADLRDKRYPLRVGVRNQPDHADFLLMDEVFARYGFALRDIEAWGGQVREYPWPPPVRAVLSGEIDAVFDEGVDVWADQLLDADMRMLPLDEEVVQDLERIGLRRGVIPKADFPRLEQDILSLDFSGWPVFTHADVPDELITAFCAGLEARKETIPWHGLGPLPLERMCQDQDGTPIDIPFHRAAERYWREQGYQPTSAAR
jgi:TRAP-type uncharacterized transport system substrate-binding protein